MFSKWSERKEWSVEPPHYRKSWHNPPSQSAVRKQGREYQLLKRVAQAFCDCDWDVTGRTLLFFCFWKNIIVVQYGLFVDLRPLGDAVIKLFWGKLNLMEISVSVIYPEIWFKPLTLIHVPYDDVMYSFRYTNQIVSCSSSLSTYQYLESYLTCVLQHLYYSWSLGTEHTFALPFISA